MSQLSVKAIRKSLGLTREEFAALIPVAPTTVWRWENGTASPHPIIRARIEEIADGIRRSVRP